MSPKRILNIITYTTNLKNTVFIAITRIKQGTHISPLGVKGIREVQTVACTLCMY